MEEIINLLPFLIPLLVIELILVIAALVHIFRHDNYKVGNRVMWVCICLIVNIIGPVLYFIIGRGED